MARGRLWTEQEDDRIIEALSDDSTNISEVFRILSNEFGRTENAVTNRWYKVLNNPSHPKYRGTACFILISRRKRLTNCKKNSKNHHAVRSTKSLWNKLISWIRNI